MQLTAILSTVGEKQPFDSIVVLSVVELLLGSIELSNIESARALFTAAVDIRVAINEQLFDQHDAPTSNCIMQTRVTLAVLGKVALWCWIVHNDKGTYLFVDIA